MSRLNTDNLSNEKIQQLLAAVGARSREDTSQDSEVQDYDWRQPRYFGLSQLAKINDFAEAAARELLEEFARICQNECTVSVVSAQQVAVSEPDKENQEEPLYIAFGTDPQKPFGLAAIPKPSALLWTSRILGDTAAAKDSDRKLSKLEESLLLDVVAGLLSAFSRVYGSNLSADKCCVSDRSLIDLQGSDELFEMVFEVKSESAEISAKTSFLMCCDKLESVAGDTSTQQIKLSESQIRSALLGHIHQIPMIVRVELAKITLPFKDVMSLEVNDVVMLNKKVTDPVDVLVEDRVLFSGRPAQSGGHYAVVIT